MQSLLTFEALIRDISFDVDWFNEWYYMIGVTPCGHTPYLQIKFRSKDNFNPSYEYEQSGRKWMLSYHMTDDEVVSTALLATKQCIEHEIRELFKYKGEPIYRPHYDIQALHELSADNKVCKRKEM